MPPELQAELPALDLVLVMPVCNEEARIASTSRGQHGRLAAAVNAARTENRPGSPRQVGQAQRPDQ